MPDFDRYIMVDWSAANKPVTGKDSIWIGEYLRSGSSCMAGLLENPSTRRQATEMLGNILATGLEEGKRTLVGFDFPFGYPSGTAAALGFDGLLWRKIWSYLWDAIEDDHENLNNRFDIAEQLNETISGEAFPFWGNTERADRPYLKYKNRRDHGAGDLSERRMVEMYASGTQPAFKLAYTGSCGSQALTGIPRVWQLRTDPRLAFDTQIWPFETGLSDQPNARIILAEVYPSLVTADVFADKPKDAGQVSALARYFAEQDIQGNLGKLFEGDPNLSEEDVGSISREESWILGVTKQGNKIDG